MWGTRVFFVYAPRGVECPKCGVRVKKMPWVEDKHRLTETYTCFCGLGRLYLTCSYSAFSCRALGAYNSGPARIIKMRAKAAEMGYDPNVWFDNVELVAAREIGRETVQYVANIYKYYLAYRLTAHQQLQRKAARGKAGIR